MDESQLCRPRRVALAFLILVGGVLPLAVSATSAPSAAALGLPDVLVALDGRPVTTPAQWQQQRRPEIVKMLAREMYGQSPSPRPTLPFDVFDQDRSALGGEATRIQVAIWLNGTREPAGVSGARLDLLIYLPNRPLVRGPVPLLFGMNFWGNHAVHTDDAIRLSPNYMEEGDARNPYVDLTCVRNHRATAACRGIDAKRWPISSMMARGYGFATAYKGDVDADLSDTVVRDTRALFPSLQNGADSFGVMGAWAWAMSRALDYLVTVPTIDASRIALFGWSRLGKAAIWAAANDDRFAALISSESGSGGAKAFHYNQGENIARLNNVFPHWYAKSFRQYIGRETTMLFDQHFALACVAPRPLYVAASEGDVIFNPIGEFVGVRGATSVYRLLGIESSNLLPEEMPAINQSKGSRLAFHWRSGMHDVTPLDWQYYLAFLDREMTRAAFSSEPLSSTGAVAGRPDDGRVLSSTSSTAALSSDRVDQSKMDSSSSAAPRKSTLSASSSSSSSTAAAEGMASSSTVPSADGEVVSSTSIAVWPSTVSSSSGVPSQSGSRDIDGDVGSSSGWSSTGDAHNFGAPDGFTSGSDSRAIPRSTFGAMAMGLLLLGRHFLLRRWAAFG